MPQLTIYLYICESIIQNMKKDKMMKVLYELLKNSKKSDRDLAKTLNSSQPTVTRIRKKLERMGYITEYTVVPNLVKIGFELVAFTFMNILRRDEKTGETNKKLAGKAHKWIAENPKILFGAGGEGMRGKNCMMVTIHKDFTDYSQFISDFRTRWSKNIKDIDSFIVPLGGRIPRAFSFRYLEREK